MVNLFEKYDELILGITQKEQESQIRTGKKVFIE